MCFLGYNHTLFYGVGSVDMQELIRQLFLVVFHQSLFLIIVDSNSPVNLLAFSISIRKYFKYSLLLFVWRIA